MQTTPYSDAPATPAQVDRIAYGAVHLDVSDLDRALRFWRDIVGLQEVDSVPGSAMLGAGGRTLIVLHDGATRPAGRGHAGLYHVAIHLPDAVEFARVLARLARAGVPQSPTEHVFSQATYVRDPDGIMLELTLETPERYGSIEVGPTRVVLYDRDGRSHEGTEPLDVAAALAPLGDGPTDLPLPAGTFVGHVHLHVPDLVAAYGWYRDVVGFSEHALMTAIGMADLGAGGVFPHRIALNVWHGPQARQPEPGTAGLRVFELQVPASAALAALARRAGTSVEADGSATLVDPAGNRLVVAVAAPA